MKAAPRTSSSRTWAASTSSWHWLVQAWIGRPGVVGWNDNSLQINELVNFPHCWQHHQLQGNNSTLVQSTKWTSHRSSHRQRRRHQKSCDLLPLPLPLLLLSFDRSQFSSIWFLYFRFNWKGWRFRPNKSGVNQRLHPVCCSVGRG